MPITSVKAAARTLDLFEAFGLACRPMTLTEIARLIRVPVSSCHALLSTLRARGYVYTTTAGRELYVTRKLLDVAQTIAAHDPLLELLAPHLAALRDETGETVILGKRDGLGVVYLDVAEGLHTVRYHAQPGDRKPLHSSSIGKTVLGMLTPDGLEKTLRTIGTPAVTANTITDAAALRADLAASRTRGYYLTRGENVDDVMAIAAAAVLHGEVLGVAIAGPMHRMQANLARHADGLLRTVAAIER